MDEAEMGQDQTRRAFLKESSSTAALTSLVAISRAGAADQEPRRTPYICVTCGSQFAESVGPPEHCPICEDERQYVNPDGQQWTTLEALRASHRTIFKEEERGLYSINAEPKVGIGQRAFLIKTSRGNVLWDCVALLDEPTIARIRELGGIAAIAISHPHYYTTMVEWSRAFGDAPIHLHEAERKWVMRPDSCIRFWQGESLDLPGGLKLLKTGGHFEGYQVLHWPQGAEGRGALMAGDQPQICMDPKQVSFMYSYPNYLPLNAREIRHIMECLDTLDYDRVYGAFFIRGKGVIPAKGKEIVRRSGERYLRAIRS
jgi:hypothetical protein